MISSQKGKIYWCSRSVELDTLKCWENYPPTKLCPGHQVQPYTSHTKPYPEFIRSSCGPKLSTTLVFFHNEIFVQLDALHKHRIQSGVLIREADI